MTADYEDDEDHGCGGVDGWEVGDHDDEVARMCIVQRLITEQHQHRNGVLC